MGDTMFMRAQEAVVEAALRAGCEMLCAYPITPVEDMTEYWMHRAPHFEGVLSLMPESELEAGAMMYGFGASGKRVAFASTGAGFSLIHESLGSIMGAEVPCVLFAFPRAGGLSISQADYHMATKAPSHGDERIFVLAPMGTQEAVDLTMEAFYLADKYRNPVMIMMDYTLGLTMEVVEFNPVDESDLPSKNEWRLTGERNREARRSLAMAAAGGITAQNVAGQAQASTGMSRSELKQLDLRKKYASLAPRSEAIDLEGAKLTIVAYGTMARMILPVLRQLRAEGLKVGLLRPITLFPFPAAAVREAAEQTGKIGVFECNSGQMVDDVRLAVQGAAPVELYGRPGGATPAPEEIAAEIRRLIGAEVKV